MLKSTIDRYQIVRREVYKRLGKMPTMEAYADVAKEMRTTEETVRKINKWDMVPTKSGFLWYLCSAIRDNRVALFCKPALN